MYISTSIHPSIHTYIHTYMRIIRISVGNRKKEKKFKKKKSKSFRDLLPWHSFLIKNNTVLLDKTNEKITLCSRFALTKYFALGTQPCRIISFFLFFFVLNRSKVYIVIRIFFFLLVTIFFLSFPFFSFRKFYQEK